MTKPKSGAPAVDPSLLDDVDWLREQYIVRGRTLTDIGDEVGTNRITVAATLKRHGITIRPRGPRPRRPEILSNREWLEEQLRTKTLTEISKELGCNSRWVRESLREFGLKRPFRSTRTPDGRRSESMRKAWQRRYPNGVNGAKATNWSGGRRYNGPYVDLHRTLVKELWPDHPRLKKEGWSYTREHILIKEAEIGRCLRKGEVVHHDNLVKDDNRPENLILKENGQHIKDHFAEVRLLRKRVAYLEALLDEHGIPYE